MTIIIFIDNNLILFMIVLMINDNIILIQPEMNYKQHKTSKSDFLIISQFLQDIGTSK